jgi:DNA invertase Pin-like site-specific DNA recombinase
VKT